MSIELDKETVAYLKRLIKRGGHEGEQARNVLKAAGLLEANVIKEEERDEHGRWTSGGGGNENIDDSKLSLMVGRNNPGNSAYDGPMLARHIAVGDTIKETGMLRTPGVVTEVTRKEDGIHVQLNKPDGSYSGFQRFSPTDIININRQVIRDK